MSGDLSIRKSRASDRATLEDLYPAAFPEEDLLPVVRELLPRPDVLSLVATLDELVVGHVMFTMCDVEGDDVSTALLAPLGVTPAAQKTGIGSALVRDGLARLAEDGIAVVLVLGDPAYYGRFGFEPERGIEPPLPIPNEWRDAWQSLALNNNRSAHVGTLLAPEPWNRPELWSA